MKNTAVKLDEMKIPTNERISKGDIAFRDGGIYYSVVPTVLELWREKGFLGLGSLGEDRFAACEVLFELAESTRLMASNTTDLMRVPGCSTQITSDIGPLDHIRFMMKNMSLESSKIFRDMIVAPGMLEHRVDRMAVVKAMDELIAAVEMWKRSVLFEEL